LAVTNRLTAKGYFFFHSRGVADYRFAIFSPRVFYSRGVMFVLIRNLPSAKHKGYLNMQKSFSFQLCLLFCLYIKTAMP